MNPVADLVLCTINTGRFYSQHRSMAERGLDVADWRLHVRLHAIHEFRKSGGRHAFSVEEIHQAAEELRAYYADHITEG